MDLDDGASTSTSAGSLPLSPLSPLAQAGSAAAGAAGAEDLVALALGSSGTRTKGVAAGSSQRNLNDSAEVQCVAPAGS